MAFLSGTNPALQNYQDRQSAFYKQNYDPSIGTNYGGVQAEVSGGATAGSRESDLAQQLWGDRTQKAFLASLSPDELDEYSQLMAADDAKSTRNMRSAFGVAAGAVGGLGALGAAAPAAGGVGGLESLAGAGAESFPVSSSSVSLGANMADPMAIYAPETFGAGPLEASAGAGSGYSFGSPEQRAADYSTDVGGYGSTDTTRPAIPTGGGGNPIVDAIRQTLGISSKASPYQQVSQGIRTSANLLDMYNTYQNKKRNQQFTNSLTSLYGQDSPYAQQLNKSLARAYAASGRRSDVGGRNVELQAKLAEMNSRLAPTLNQANIQQGNYNNRFLGSALQFGDQSGLLEKGINGLAGLFGG